MLKKVLNYHEHRSYGEQDKVWPSITTLPRKRLPDEIREKLYDDIKKQNIIVMFEEITFSQSPYLYWGQLKTEYDKGKTYPIYIFKDMPEIISDGGFLGQSLSRYDSNIIFVDKKKTKEFFDAQVVDFSYAAIEYYKENVIITANIVKAYNKNELSKALDEYRQLCIAFDQFVEENMPTE